MLLGTFGVRNTVGSLDEFKSCIFDQFVKELLGSLMIRATSIENDVSDLRIIDVATNSYFVDRESPVVRFILSLLDFLFF